MKNEQVLMEHPLSDGILKLAARYQGHLQNLRSVVPENYRWTKANCRLQSKLANVGTYLLACVVIGIRKCSRLQGEVWRSVH